MHWVVARHDNFPVILMSASYIVPARPLRCLNLDVAARDRRPCSPRGQPHRSKVDVTRPVVTTHRRFFSKPRAVAHRGFHAFKAVVIPGGG